MESINVVIDDATILSVSIPKEQETNMFPLIGKNGSNMSSDINLEKQVKNNKSVPKEVKISEGQPSSTIREYYPFSNIIGNLEEAVSAWKKDKVDYLEMLSNICFTTPIELKNVKEALVDECWVNAMQEELDQVRNDA